MDSRAFCDQLVHAPDENTVVNILKEANLWDAPNAWCDFGGQENNFSSIGNQSAHAEAALVEKLVNSIDAVLMLQCYLAGIEPEGPEAPSNTKAAVEKFFNIRNANLAELTATSLTTHAQRIGLVATGSKKLPNLTIFDLGEGQRPEDFPSTFLSLGKANKVKIPFVQGKFNMGGTGVLQFCGEQNFQLILSRRHPSLGKSDWGFTLVRRMNPVGNAKNSVYRYLAPYGKVPRFEHKTNINLNLDITLANGTALPDLEYGSVIKLFGYQLPGGVKTNIVFDLFNRVSCLLPGVALPIRFYERRNYVGHSMESTMLGLSTRLARDSRDNLEFEPSTHRIFINNHLLRVTVYAFKRTEKGESASIKFRDREGVMFLVNGQSHGNISKSFFRRQTVKMSYVANDILVLVDASALDGRSREDLFMNSRDRLRDGTLAREIEKAVESEVSSHELLKLLNSKRREAALGERLKNDALLEQLLESIIKRSPALASLFITGHRLADPFKLQPAQADRLDFRGERYPTFFRLAPGQEVRSAHLGQRFRVQFETDAQNTYFDRADMPGNYEVTLDGLPVAQNTLSFNLLNGVGNLSVHLPLSVKVGTRLSWQGTVSDYSRVDPFTFTFERVVAAATAGGGGPSAQRKPPVVPGPGPRTIPQSLDVPKITRVARKDWGQYEFDRDSALAVRLSPAGSYDYFVNIDNVYLAHEIKVQPTKREILENQFLHGLALFGMALLKANLNSPENSSGDIEAEIHRMSRAFAPVLIPMIQHLSELEAGLDAEISDDVSVDLDEVSAD